MDALPEATGQLLLLAPSALPGRAFLDRMGRFRCEMPEPGVLRLIGPLPAGRYQMRMLIRGGAFDSATVMLPLIEWPSRRGVQAGPFDFDHTDYRMAVPTFRTTVNGEGLGLVWCEVPSPQDLAAGRIRALWGIEVAEAGEATIELSVSPEDRQRLRWSDLAGMDLVPDDRYSLPLPAGIADGPRHPRLLAGEEDFARLGRGGDPLSARLMRRLEQFAESGRDGTYDYRTIAVALLARCTGQDRWRQEAIDRAMALVQKPCWGYHDVPEIMGWNNDRDAGNRMLELAVAFDWLYEDFDDAQRGRIAAKLAYHADIAYRATLLQKNYWYHRCNEAHGQGLWCGLAAAAGVLIGHDERAEKWLAWTLGGFDDAARHLQHDGIATWYVFNVSWHVYTLAVLDSLLAPAGREGRAVLGQYPFFENYPRGVLQVTHPRAVEPVLGCHLLYLARRSRSPRVQADALRLLGLDPASETDRYPQAVHALAPLFCDGDLAPGEGEPIRPAVCAARGIVSCRGGNGSRFTFDCGPGSAPAHHASQNFINRTWYTPAAAGSFSWSVESVDDGGAARSIVFQPAILKSYRQDTRDANRVTIDGRGHFLEGRWIGSALPLERVAYLEHCAGDGEVTYVCGNASGACADDLGVRLLVREWVFFHAAGVAVMRDRLRTAEPRQLAWHLHATNDTWHPLGPGRWFTTEQGRRLLVCALASSHSGGPVECPPAGLTDRIVRPDFVPTYTMGVNTYKTLDWQPEVRPAKPDIPPFWDLQFSPPGRATEWELVTIMGVDADLSAATADAAGDCLHVRGLPGSAEVLLPRPDRLRLPDTPWELFAAAAARPGPDAPWRTFHTTRRRRGQSPWEVVAPAADLLYPSGSQPQPMDLLTAMPPAAPILPRGRAIAFS